MADEHQFFINGQPLDVKDFQSNGESFGDANPHYIRGLRELGPITLTGRWVRANERICANCDAIFVVNEGQPIAFVSDGTTERPICDKCAMALLGINNEPT